MWVVMCAVVGRWRRARGVRAGLACRAQNTAARARAEWCRGAGAVPGGRAARVGARGGAARRVAFESGLTSSGTVLRTLRPADAL